MCHQSASKDKPIDQIEVNKSYFYPQDTMDLTYYNSSFISDNILFLYGEKDDITPKEATYLFLQWLFPSGTKDKTSVNPLNQLHPRFV